MKTNPALLAMRKQARALGWGGVVNANIGAHCVAVSVEATPRALGCYDSPRMTWTLDGLPVSFAAVQAAVAEEAGK